jgi:hypothetical protein
MAGGCSSGDVAGSNLSCGIMVLEMEMEEASTGLASFGLRRKTYWLKRKA